MCVSGSAKCVCGQGVFGHPYESIPQGSERKKKSKRGAGGKRGNENKAEVEEK